MSSYLKCCVCALATGSAYLVTILCFGQEINVICHLLGANCSTIVQAERLRQAIAVCVMADQDPKHRANRVSRVQMNEPLLLENCETLW